eukprot:CAMPEP_0198289224 /NCGR_PEP_ID=MMETSP1449-20131203/7489_1 /TAXON_ID=420275 /ORGANISM="Attheya septentrionalis, Strain CCMP2084" /LENGTH=651 /DNA_ID=CAMNT_0043987521 /DNA_START=212 /DNA_END=2167 /DNA_ORIENTATION=+
MTGVSLKCGGRRPCGFIFNRLRHSPGKKYNGMVTYNWRSCASMLALSVDSDGHDVVGRRHFSRLSKEKATAPVNFDPSKRWMAVPPANAVHLSIGSVYVYSMWTPGFTTALGVVSSAPADWTHSQVLPVFSTAAVVLGVTTSALGSWVEKSGPRKAGLVGSMFWSSALCTTALGVHLHSLPLLYMGYGMFGGVGWGLMYLAPVTTVMKWFPDRRGLATGMALSAFGAGAALAPVLIQTMVDLFSVAPDFIGQTQQVILETLPDGSQIVASDSSVGTPGQHVVVATESDVGRLNYVTTGPGVYALDSGGDTGMSKALGALGLFYGVLGALGSRFMMVPHPEWTPAPATSKAEEVTLSPTTEIKQQDIGLPVDFVTGSTKQFPLLWLSVFGNATGGLALLSSSKLMITDIWAGVAPEIVTASFATGYVSALGIGMAAGRFGWSALSDYLGRKNTYAVFGLGIPIVGLAPSLCHSASIGGNDGIVLPLLMTFYGGSVLAITFYGGIFSVLPAYIADLFGQKHAGAIHGKALTAWAASAVAGPMGLAYLRSQSVEHGIQDLIEKVHDPGAFHQAFGCSLEETETIRTLIDAKTITIKRLMEVVPDETIDPTPFLYDTTCYMAAGLIGVSFVSNMMIQPLDVKKILEDMDQKEVKE